MQQTQTRRLTVPYASLQAQPQLQQEPGWRGFASGSQVELACLPESCYVATGLDTWGHPLTVPLSFNELQHAVVYGFVRVVD